MILFFGTREVKQDDPDGAAQLARCPACGQTVTLQPRAGRMYFHVFWLPIIPLGETQHYLQCPACRTRYAHWPQSRNTPASLP